MRLRIGILFVALLIIAGASVGVLLAFRGSDGNGNGDSGLEAYLREVRLLVNDIDTRTEERTVGSPDEAFVAWSIVLRDTASELSAIAPPDELSDAHEQLYTALDDGGAAVLAVGDAHPGVPSLEEALALVNQDEDVGEANARARDACIEMETYAKAHDVSVDLELC